LVPYFGNFGKKCIRNCIFLAKIEKGIGPSDFENSGSGFGIPIRATLVSAVYFYFFPKIQIPIVNEHWALHLIRITILRQISHYITHCPL
jgi:hypothetical protein